MGKLFALLLLVAVLLGCEKTQTPIVHRVVTGVDVAYYRAGERHRGLR